MKFKVGDYVMVTLVNDYNILSGVQEGDVFQLDSVDYLAGDHWVKLANGNWHLFEYGQVELLPWCRSTLWKVLRDEV